MEDTHEKWTWWRVLIVTVGVAGLAVVSGKIGLLRVGRSVLDFLCALAVVEVVKAIWNNRRR
jgi:hypothetical protein